MTWKNAERKFARALGVERNSKTGLGSNTPDIVTDQFSIEVKHGKQIPRMIQKYMNQAVANCVEGLIPVVIMHPLRGRYEDGLVVIRFSDFKEIIEVEDAV